MQKHESPYSAVRCHLWLLPLCNKSNSLLVGGNTHTQTLAINSTNLSDGWALYFKAARCKRLEQQPSHHHIPIQEPPKFQVRPERASHPTTRTRASDPNASHQFGSKTPSGCLKFLKMESSRQYSCDSQKGKFTRFLETLLKSC